MSKLKTDAIRNTSASADALTFDTSGNTKIADSEELQFGDGADLKLFHDGSNSHIHDAGTGHLYIRTSSIQINNAANNESIIYGIENGAVKIYYDNSKKLETIATGVNVIGGIRLGGNNAANELDDYEEGTHVTASTNGSLYNDANCMGYTKIGTQITVSGQVRVQTGSADAMRLSLPVAAAANVNDASHNFTGALSIYNSTLDGTDTGEAAGIVVQVDAGDSNLYFKSLYHDGNWRDMPTTANGYYRFTITYIAA
tara:strand:- start:56 stop:823 length:768 start_codon:yes stop_codon:yes gene_type:complete